jgi:hypothetical protein
MKTRERRVNAALKPGDKTFNQTIIFCAAALFYFRLAASGRRP